MITVSLRVKSDVARGYWLRQRRCHVRGTVRITSEYHLGPSLHHVRPGDAVGTVADLVRSHIIITKTITIACRYDAKDC